MHDLQDPHDENISEMVRWHRGCAVPVNIGGVTEIALDGRWPIKAVPGRENVAGLPTRLDVN